MTTLTNLLDFDPAQLVAYCADLGEKPFRAKQLQRWIHQFGASDFDAMTDLAKSLRDKLKLHAVVAAPAVISASAVVVQRPTSAAPVLTLLCAPGFIC